MRSVVLCVVLSLGCAPRQGPEPPFDSGPAFDVSATVDVRPADVGSGDARRIDLSPLSDATDDAGWPPGPWRSELYPADWSPGFAAPDGRALVDFSWAGYRNGEEPPVIAGPTFNVVDYGADPTATTDSQPAIQAAIDAASVAGGVVEIPAGTFRVDDTLLVAASNIVVRGRGPAASRLWFTRSAGMSNRAQLTFRGSMTTVSEELLLVDAARGARVITVASADAFRVGDDVVLGWNITPQFIAEHEMTGVWTAFNDTWQPFFRRQVVAVRPGEIELDLPVHYPALTRDGAAIRHQGGLLREVGVEGLGFADAVDWAQAWAEVQVHVIELDGVADGWIRDVESFPSPGAPASGPGADAHLQNGGIIVRSSKRVTVADSRMELAQNRGGGGCGYLFEVRQSSEVLFRDLVGRAGRHNFIQNWGFGASGIVWLRVHSSEGRTFLARDVTTSGTGDSEFHHSLAMANLIDSSTFEDGFSALNRKDESTGAGHTATETVFWNITGGGRVRSYQFGFGYVIGTSPGLSVLTDMPTDDPVAREQLESLGPWTASWPVDWVEGRGHGADLQPRSLYEDQRARRL